MSVQVVDKTRAMEQYLPLVTPCQMGSRLTLQKSISPTNFSYSLTQTLLRFPKFTPSSMGLRGLYSVERKLS